MGKAASIAALSLLLPASAALAVPVTGPWVNAAGQGDGPITNQNTASPTVGDGTSNSADGEMLSSAFAAITLGQAGDEIVFTAQVTLTGTVNSAATSAIPRTQFRFGIFDGDGDDLGWVGYYMSNKHGNVGSPAGALAEKVSGNTSVYLDDTLGRTVLDSEQGNGTATSLFHDGTYSMSITITRNESNQLVVIAVLSGVGGNAFFQDLAAVDPTPGPFTFDAVGFFLGSNLDTDQAQFSNVDVSTNVPEPAAFGVLALGAIALRTRCRSRS